MINRRAFMIAGVFAPMQVSAETPRRGLAWNKTGLPLVFPLRIQTVPGHDYFLKLASAETGADAMAAHFTGGALFRILCPPGRFWVVVSRGQVWKSEADLFGPETETFQFPEPLEFKISGIRTRQGWRVDLRDFARPSIII